MTPSDVIYLQSTFDGWCGSCAPMARLSPLSDVWVRNETRPDGEWIEWKFTIGVWNITEDVPIECDVTGGAWHNRGIVVSSGVMTLPTVCFSGCGECPADSDHRCLRGDWRARDLLRLLRGLRHPSTRREPPARQDATRVAQPRAVELAAGVAHAEGRLRRGGHQHADGAGLPPDGVANLGHRST